MTEPYSAQRRDDENLARAIREYWQRTGYAVTVRLQHVNDGRFGYLGVRSNLVNGLPRNFHPDVSGDIARPA